MLRVERYEPRWQTEWDQFVARSKNGVFLFSALLHGVSRRPLRRPFAAVFRRSEIARAAAGQSPGHDAGVSHGGLTFGGFVTDDRMRTPVMLALFDALADALPGAGPDSRRLQAGAAHLPSPDGRGRLVRPVRPRRPAGAAGRFCPPSSCATGRG